MALFFSRSAESTETAKNTNRSGRDKMCKSLASAQNFQKRVKLISLFDYSSVNFAKILVKFKLFKK